MRNAAAALRPAAVAQLPRPVAVAVAARLVVVAGVVAVLGGGGGRAGVARGGGRGPGVRGGSGGNRNVIIDRNVNRDFPGGGGGPIVGQRYRGGIWYGTEGRRFWRGRWLQSGVAVLAADADRLSLGLLNNSVADRTNAKGLGSPAPFLLAWPTARVHAMCDRGPGDAASPANAESVRTRRIIVLDLLIQIRHQRRPADRISLPQQRRAHVIGQARPLQHDSAPRYCRAVLSPLCRVMVGPNAGMSFSCIAASH